MNEIRAIDYTIADFDAINNPSIKLAMWQQVAAELDRIKVLEAHMRKTAVTIYFPEAGEGTTNFDLGQGYILKAVKKNNYRMSANDKVEEALNKIEELGEKGRLIAERLVKWDPRLSLTEYKALDIDNNIDKAIKANIDEVLTISDGMPSLEIVAPKSK